MILTSVTDAGAVLVLHDPEDKDPQRRYKMVVKIRPYMLHVAFSANGLDWPGETVPIEGLVGVDASGLTRWNGAYLLAAHRDKHHGRRKLHVFMSYDFTHWTEAAGIFTRSPESQPGNQEFNAGEQVHLGASLWARWPSLLGFYGQWHGHLGTSLFD